MIRASRSHRRRLGAGTWYVESNGSTTDINLGSGATLDNLPLADFTFEGWLRRDGDGNVYAKLASKYAPASGWLIAFDNQNWRIYAGLKFDTQTCYAYQDAADPVLPREWFHWALVWDAAAKQAQVFVRGYKYPTGHGIGNYQVDNALDTFLVNGPNCLLGAQGWTRFSDNKRYTATFTPAARC